MLVVFEADEQEGRRRGQWWRSLRVSPAALQPWRPSCTTSGRRAGSSGFTQDLLPLARTGPALGPRITWDRRRHRVLTWAP